MGGAKIERSPRPLWAVHAARPTTVPVSTCNKSTTYFENSILRKFRFFFHPKYFTKCIHNVSLCIDLMLQWTKHSIATKKTHIFWKPSIKGSWIIFLFHRKIFHLVYSQCFTMYRFNVAVNWNIPLQQKKPTYFGNPLLREFVLFFVPPKNISLCVDQMLQWTETFFRYLLKHCFYIRWNNTRFKRVKHFRSA